MPKGSVIGFPASIVPAMFMLQKGKGLEDNGFFMRDEEELLNELWTDRPAKQKSSVFLHLEKYSGESTRSKLDRVLGKLRDNNEEYLVTGTLDEIAWVLNLRGQDIPHSPVFFSYLFISKNNISLFTDIDESHEALKGLKDNDISLLPYSEFQDFLSKRTGSIVVDPSKINYKVYSSIETPQTTDSNILTDLKSIKNPTEISGFKRAHIRDAVALSECISTLCTNYASYTEHSASQLLTALRSLQPLNRGESFPTISAIGPHAAIIHYKPPPVGSSRLNNKELYLLDSGGQYEDGTIDTTRTFHFGTASDWEKECYTRVLMGNLDIEMTVWPKEYPMTGAQLDILARRYLWEKGLDFGHGTGHGVGHFLNVHEGPQGISRLKHIVLLPGMNVTNEPGYYEQNRFGIRIENILFVTEKEAFYSFENITRVPYAKNLIEKSLLNPRHILQINSYHSVIHKEISHLVPPESLSWLTEATSPI